MAPKIRICDISKDKYLIKDLVNGLNLRENLYNLIKSEHPEFSKDSFICIKELNKYRKKYLENILTSEVGTLSKIQQEVISSVSSREILSVDIEEKISKISFGAKVADKVAEFGGSWFFIISFFSFIAIWIGFNSLNMFLKIFDPFPYILLNLILSCLAAIQAPIIMMSQNRKESKDRERSEQDYKIDLKAELEIRLLHEKIDHMISQHNQHLIEIQQLHIDLMEDVLNGIKAKNH